MSSSNPKKGCQGICGSKCCQITGKDCCAKKVPKKKQSTDICPECGIKGLHDPSSDCVHNSHDMI